MDPGAEKPKNMGFGCPGSMIAITTNIDSGLDRGYGEGAGAGAVTVRCGTVRCSAAAR